MPTCCSPRITCAVARGDRAIMEVHLADAIESLVEASTKSLSADRSPKDPYRRQPTPALERKSEAK